MVFLNHEDQKKVKKIEQKLDKLTKERLLLTAELAGYEWGTPEFSKRYVRLQQIDKDEPVLFNEWLELQNS